MAEWSKAHYLESPAFVVVEGTSPGMNVLLFFLKVSGPFLLTNFFSDKIDLKAQLFTVKIKELTCNCF